MRPLCLLLVVHLATVLANPVPSTTTTFYEDLVLDVHTKCPYAVKTLLYPHESFLKGCTPAAKSLSIVDVPNKLEEDLCVLYRNNFMYLCDLSDNLQGAIAQQHLANYTQDTVCAILGNNTYLREESKQVAAAIRDQTRTKCKRICLDLNDALRPICAGVALLVNVTASVRVQPAKPMHTVKGDVVAEVPREPETVPQTKQLPRPTQRPAAVGGSVAKKVTEGKHDEGVKQENKTAMGGTTVDKGETNIKGPVLLPAPPKLTNQPEENRAQTNPIVKGKDDDSVKKVTMAEQVDSPALISKVVPNIQKSTSPKLEDVDDEENPENDGLPDVDINDAIGDVAEVEKPKTDRQPSNVRYNGKPDIVGDDDDTPSNYKNQDIDDGDSYFFSYFMMICVMFVGGYIIYHNKQKILALIIEGRRSRKPQRARRPNSANYHKLDSNLEEAVTSSCNKTTTQVIY